MYELPGDPKRSWPTHNHLLDAINMAIDNFNQDVGARRDFWRSRQTSGCAGHRHDLWGIRINSRKKMTAVKCLNLRAVYRQQEYISLMCLSEADTGGHPSRTGLGSASPCALLCCISPQRGSISKENMALGWQTVWSGGPLGSSGRCAPLAPQWPSGPYGLPSAGHIFWVPSCVRIAEAHKY